MLNLYSKHCRTLLYFIISKLKGNLLLHYSINSCWTTYTYIAFSSHCFKNDEFGSQYI